MSARDALYEFERNLRSSSNAYRQLISTQPKLPTLFDVQKQLVGDKSLLLSYFIGDDVSYLLAVWPDKVRLIELQVSEEDAKQLGIPAGSLTRGGLHQVLLGNSETSVLPRLSRPQPVEDLQPKLHSLWHVLFPAELRPELSSVALEHLIVLPDGPLALLPLEALVVDLLPGLKYVLDVCPPISYGAGRRSSAYLG